MNERFSPDAAAQLPDAERRRRAADAANGLDMPSAETEEWRYSPVGSLSLDSFTPQTTQPIGTAPAAADIAGAVASAVIIDGFVTEISVDEGWAAKGLAVSTTAIERAEVGDESTKLDALHLAFAPNPLRITVPNGLAVDGPIVIRQHRTTAGVAAFPHVRVEVGEAAEVSVIERQTSVDGAVLTVALTEIEIGDASNARYLVVQDLADETWQSQRIVTRVGAQATSATAIAAFGGGYARVRTDTDLAGAGAHGDLAAAYYADRDQTLDFRTYQHHLAPNTTSDLLFKGASDDRASSIYTGLIHIHEDGAGSSAHQTNRNIKLSDDAWAWSVPNLEIENNDVRCSHASTVSPIDVDQQFYLHARGVPPAEADRLVVAGFFDEVLGRFRSEEIRTEVTALVAAKLAARAEAAGGENQ